MLYVNLQTQANAARQNMSCLTPLSAPPEGWIAIPEALEAQAYAYLPYLALTLDENGAVTAVSEAPHETPDQPEEQLDEITQIQLALAELAAMVTQA